MSMINFTENTIKWMVRKDCDLTSFLSDPQGCFSVLDIHIGKYRMKTEVKRLFWDYILELCLSEELIHLLSPPVWCWKVSIVF